MPMSRAMARSEMAVGPAGDQQAAGGVLDLGDGRGAQPLPAAGV